VGFDRISLNRKKRRLNGKAFFVRSSRRI